MEMLPWLINDSLLSDERAAVLDHAQSCVMCRREMKSLQDLRDSINILFSPVPIPVPDMRNINARIDKLINRQNWARRSISWIGEFFASPWRAAYVAQSVLLVVLAAALLWPATREPEYSMLTQASDLADGHYVRVVFSPDLTHADLKELLDELELSVVAGPSDRGVYTLATENSIVVEERDTALASLLKNRSVLFAQPVNRGARP
jgi:hypothetical protein